MNTVPGPASLVTTVNVEGCPVSPELSPGPKALTRPGLSGSAVNLYGLPCNGTPA